MSHLTIKDELRRLRSNVAAMGMRPSADGACGDTAPLAVTEPQHTPRLRTRQLLVASAGWMLSAISHSALLVVLGLIVLAPDSMQQWIGVELAVDPREEKLEDFTSTAVELTALAADPASGGADSAAVQFSTLDALAQVPVELHVSDLLGGGRSIVDDVATMVGDGRELGLAELGEGSEQGAGVGNGQGGEGDGDGYAMFYGSRALGKDIAFVVDCSQSMTGNRWQKACTELMACITQMAAEQRFYVVFFNTEDFPQFFPVIDNFLSKADSDNVEKLGRWMRNVMPMGGTDPSKALRRALELEPDSIFLLSDGEFDLRPTMQVLMQHNRANTVIHTVALGSPAGQRMLVTIAEATGGTYRFVPLYP